MGLLRSHVSVIPGVAVQLYIQSHKNDTTAKGNSIQLAWLTQSGVPLGDMTGAHMSLLTQDALPGDSPFFVPTSRLGVFTAVAPGSVRFISGALFFEGIALLKRIAVSLSPQQAGAPAPAC